MFYCQPSARLRGPGARPRCDDRREPGLSWGEPRSRPAGGEVEPSHNSQAHATNGPRIFRVSFTVEGSVVTSSNNSINVSANGNSNTNNAIANEHQEHEHQYQHEANTGTGTSNQDNGEIDSENSTNTDAQSSSDIMETADLADRFANLRINLSPGESSNQ